MINAAVYNKMVQVAKARKTISYMELAKTADLSLGGSDDEGMRALGLALDEIAEQEVAAGRPLLPIVVVRSAHNMPGGGLFKYARRKGLQKTDDLTFFAAELDRAYAYWAQADTPGK